MSKEPCSLSKSSLLSIFNTKLENFPKSGVVNVYGKHGIGKTTFFSNIKHVPLDHDVLKTKERTCDFMEMLKHSFIPLVLDDYELVENLPGIKELKPLRIPFYIISVNKLSLECITSHYEFPGVSVEDFAKQHSIHVETARDMLSKTNGNMTAVKLDLENFKSSRDIFLTSREYVQKLIDSSSETVVEFIDKHLFEHGNTLGIIHENYPDYSSHSEHITHSLSDADLIDMKIYSDVSWDLMHYFNVCACLIPSLYMSKEQGSLSKEQGSLSLRPGSIWTKNSNMLMKNNRLKKLRMDRDCIDLWVLKANAGHDDVPFDSYDLDSINQLSLTKIKSRVLTLLKKKCRRRSNNNNQTESE